MVKVSRPSVSCVSSADPVLIKLMQERNGQKKTTNLQSLVTLKQKWKVKEDIEHKCINTGWKRVEA